MADLKQVHKMLRRLSPAYVAPAPKNQPITLGECEKMIKRLEGRLARKIDTLNREHANATVKALAQGFEGPALEAEVSRQAITQLHESMSVAMNILNDRLTLLSDDSAADQKLRKQALACSAPLPNRRDS
tara:strand:- start:870 stop:1259 length:390 start_codon:yes stop_codon:yes gene_type:complete